MTPLFSTFSGAFVTEEKHTVTRVHCEQSYCPATLKCNWALNRAHLVTSVAQRNVHRTPVDVGPATPQLLSMVVSWMMGVVGAIV